MSQDKHGVFDVILDVVNNKIVPPLMKFSNFKPMMVIRTGMVSLIPMIIVSSVFLILFMLGCPSGSDGITFLPFLAPFLDKLMVVYNYGLSFMALYAAVAFGIAYADVYGTDKMTTALLALNCFLAINLCDFVDGQISVANFGGQGLFSCFVSSFIAGGVMSLCEKTKFEIKLPDSVPPEILGSFRAITPFAIAVPICWAIRTVAGIDIAVLLNNVLGPIFSYADSPFGYCLYVFVMLLLWSVGIHGYVVLSGVVDPLTILWGTENADAVMAGVAPTALPHVWAFSFQSLHLWIAAIWPLVLFLCFSRCKAQRAIGRTVALPSFFICEPVVFGVPIVLNPVLFVPMILSGTVSGLFAYLMTSAGFVNHVYLNLPWNTPHPLLDIMMTGGDMRALIVNIGAFLIGAVIWYPFFKAYEKQGIKEETEAEERAAA